MEKILRTFSEYKWFLLLWGLINIVQAAYTNLHFDEAYYWLYSTILSWGYFDHPPMVAVVGRIGDLISHSTLGLRLVPIIMGLFVMLGILHLAGRQHQKFHLILYVISFPLITSHIAGFLILPDAPLCFFFVFFLLAYRRYLECDSISHSLILSLAVAGMVYSKYHAVLILFFTILANFSLLSKRSFWLVALCSTTFLLPHFYWQFQNDFPSILYHVDTRTSGFSINNFLEYIGGQLLLAGPFSGLLVIYMAIKFKPQNTFENTLKYIAIGFYIFFLLYCFRSRIEAHWTSVSMIALIVVSYLHFTRSGTFKKIMPYLIYPAVILIIISRFVLAGDHLEESLRLKSNFVNMEKWANELDSISGGVPILFTNKYQDLSIYSYAKNQIMPAAPRVGSRFSQVDLYRIDSLYDGHRVLALSFGNELKWQSKNQLRHYASFIDSYYSYTGIVMDDINIVQTDSIPFLSFNLRNMTHKNRLFQCDSTQRLKLDYSVNGHAYTVFIDELDQMQMIGPFETINYSIALSEKLENKIKVKVALTSNNLRVYNDSYYQRLK